MNKISYNKIIKFWFLEKTKKIWLYNHKNVYKNIKQSNIDYIIKNLNQFFLQLYDYPINELLKTPKGCLALLILTKEYIYYAVKKNNNLYGRIDLNIVNTIFNKTIEQIKKKKFFNSYTKLQNQIVYTNVIDWSFFPNHGIVKRDKSYYYIALSKKWHYYAHVFVNWIARHYAIPGNIISKFIQNKSNNYEFGYIVPLAPIGPHITINPKYAKVGDRVNFKIKKIYSVESYESIDNNYKIASFTPTDSKYYILLWYLLHVDIEKKLRPLNSKPHISLASYVAISK